MANVWVDFYLRLWYYSGAERDRRKDNYFNSSVEPNGKEGMNDEK